MSWSNAGPAHRGPAHRLLDHGLGVLPDVALLAPAGFLRGIYEWPRAPGKSSATAPMVCSHCSALVDVAAEQHEAELGDHGLRLGVLEQRDLLATGAGHAFRRATGRGSRQWPWRCAARQWGRPGCAHELVQPHLRCPRCRASDSSASMALTCYPEVLSAASSAWVRRVCSGVVMVRPMDPREARIGVYELGRWRSHRGACTAGGPARARHHLPGRHRPGAPTAPRARARSRRYPLGCQRFLLDHAVSLVLVACNTASATALPALAAEAQLPVIGVVEPGAKSALAASRNLHLGVIGTLGTISSGAYPRAIARSPHGRGDGDPRAAPWSPWPRKGWTNDEITRAVALRYLSRLFDEDPEIDTLVLGCTHYPLLAGVLTDTASSAGAAATSRSSIRRRSWPRRPARTLAPLPGACQAARSSLHCAFAAAPRGWRNWFHASSVRFRPTSSSWIS